MTHASGNGAQLGVTGESAPEPTRARLEPRWSEPWSRSDGAHRARTLFHSTFGFEPEAQTSSPGRINLIGEHTDYSKGLSLPTILEHRAYAAARVRADSRVRIVSAQADQVDGTDGVWEGDLQELNAWSDLGWVSHAAGVLWALAERGFPARGIDIAIDSCVPIGAGLASSAALQCAVALAANECWQLALNSPEGRIELAEAAADAEVRFVNVPVGGLDQHTVLRCGPEEALLLDFAAHPPQATHQPLYFPDYGLCLLVINTLTPHDLRSVEFADRHAACERASGALGVKSLREIYDSPLWLQRVNRIPDPELRSRARHVVTEMHRVRLVAAELSGTAPAHERFVDLGKALYRSHASLDVDFGVSTEALNLAVDSAFRSGALGARLIGAGFGGSALALVRKAQLASTARQIDEDFVAHGMKRPQFLAVHAR